MHSPVSSDDGEIDLEDIGLDHQHETGDNCRNHQNKDRLGLSQQESQRSSREIEKIGNFGDNTSQPTHVSSLADAKMDEISDGEIDSLSGVSNNGEAEDGEFKDSPSFKAKLRIKSDESLTKPASTFRNRKFVFFIV